MKVIFMGTPDFAVGTLAKLVEAGHEVTGVFTQPDRPKGRGKEMAMSAVKQKALELNLPVYQPVKIREPENVDVVRNLEADVIVVVAFGQILPKTILEMKEFGCINVHASLLPAYRGASPIQSAILDGCSKTGVTTMMMDEGIDTGDILLQEEVQIDSKETAGTLFDKLCKTGAELLVNTLSGLQSHSLIRKKQDESQTNHAVKLDKAMGKIDFQESAVKIERLVRGLNPWPTAFTYYNGKVLKIWDTEVIKTESSNLPGVVEEVEKTYFTVKCAEYSLKILEVQLEGKKRMPAEDFLRGNQIKAGIHLGTLIGHEE